MSYNEQLIGPGGIVLLLSDDPDTPAMVYESTKQQYSSTYDCALSVGCIDDVAKLTAEQSAWLDAQADLVVKAFERVGR